MSIKRWLSGLSRRPKRIPDGVPEVMGQTVDEQGQQRIIRRGPIRHDTLTQDELKRVARLPYVLAEAHPVTLDGWVDGFMRDADSKGEIQIIEAIAVVYQRVTQIVELSGADKATL